MPIILNDYSIDYWITGNIIDCGKSNHPKDEEISKGQEDQNLEFMINYIIADTNPLKHHYDIKPSRVDINEKPKFQTDMHNKQRNKFKGKNPHNYAFGAYLRYPLPPIPPVPGLENCIGQTRYY